jgi:hypothetical protein
MRGRTSAPCCSLPPPRPRTQGYLLRSRIATLVAVVALTLVTVACGKDQSFIDGYNKATKPLTELNRDIGGTVNGATGASNAKISKEFAGLAGRADKVNRDLAKLNPPDDAKGPFTDLRAALKKGAADLRNASRAADESNTRDFASATAALSKHGSEITKAEAALKKKVEG